MTKTSSKKINPKKEVMMGIIDLIRHKIFYGHILQQLTKTYGAEKLGIHTMGVGKRSNELLIKLYVCEDFIRQMWEKAKDDDQAAKWLQGALEHETLHLVFDHVPLMQEFTDKVRGNVAVDCVVNSCINSENIMDNWVTPDQYGFEPHKSAYWYYNHLKDNSKFQEQCKKGAFGAEGFMEQMMGSHQMWEEAMKDPLVREFVKDIVAKAKNLCGKDYGDISGEVLAQIDDLLEKKRPIVPWNRVLRQFAASATESNLSYTVKRLSKRYGTRPGTRKEDVLNLAVAVDTSGSISDQQLVVFFNEIRWIWKNGASITIYEADAAICAEYKFKGKFTGEVHGRGGTDLEPVLKEVERRYDALIYFTDFYAPHIKKRYNIPILWVLTTELSREEFPYPWGQFIKIDDGVPEKV